MGLLGRQALGVDQPPGKLGQCQGRGRGRQQGDGGHRDPHPIGLQEGQKPAQGGQGPPFGPARRHPGGFLRKIVSGQGARLFVKPRLYIGIAAPAKAANGGLPHPAPSRISPASHPSEMGAIERLSRS